MQLLNYMQDLQGGFRPCDVIFENSELIRKEYNHELYNGYVYLSGNQEKNI